MIEILNELKNTTSTKEKFNILSKNKENESLKRILKYAYDSVSYTYGVTYNHILSFESKDFSQKNMFELLEMLSKRELTGHNALRECKNLINALNEIDKMIFKGIIDRDFKIGVSTKTLNIVATKPPIPNQKTKNPDVAISRIKKKSEITSHICHIVNLLKE